MMQMQKIKKLCLSRRQFQVINGEGGQWLGDGAALFAVPDELHIIPSALPAMYDLTGKQVDDCTWSIKTVEQLGFAGILLTDTEPGDILLHEVPGSLIVAGERLEMLYSADNNVSLLVEADELAPLDKYTERRYYARRNGNGWAVVCKNGYAVVAYILPWRVMGDAIRDTIDLMRTCLGKQLRSQERKEETAEADIVEELKAAFGEPEEGNYGI